MEDGIGDVEDGIEDHIVSYYEKPFTEVYSWRPKLDGLVFESIDQLSADRLQRS